MDSPTNIIQFIQLDQIPYAVLLVAGAMLLSRVLSRSLDALGERVPSRRLLFKQAAAVARFVIAIVATLGAAGAVLQLDDQVLLAVGGSAAVAVGFAFKDLLASLMAGMILLFDRPFQVGDRVQFAGQYGEIREIGLRSVRLVTLDDNLVSIPNNRFLSDVVSCANAGSLEQMCVFRFYIGCDEDFERARRLLYEAVAASRYVFLDRPVVVHVREGPVPEGAERFAIELTAKAYVLDGRYESAFATDVTVRVLRAFRAAGIRTAGQLEWQGAPVTA